GRTDEQVKIRGFRVEPGEVERALRGHAEVGEAAVVAVSGPDGTRRLVAYVSPPGLSPASMRAFLRERLPEYMVPAGLVSLESLPLTPNGKVDRRALVARAPEAWVERATAYVAPRTPAEELLVEIWADVLGVPEVG